MSGSSSQPVKKNIALKLKPSPAKKTKGRRASKTTSRGRKKKDDENDQVADGMFTVGYRHVYSIQPLI